MAEYCLRWNNHQPNLVTVFSELLNAETLVDVTLATDGHFIHAHKLVLSACSVYFKDLFGSNPCKHPIVFLKDIKIEDLKTVIDFIYRGEVNVSQERLQDVLKTAESLRIKGLADKPFSYDEYPSQSRSGGQQHLSSSFSSQRSSLTDSREQQQSGDGEDLIDVSGGDGHSPPANKKRKVASSQDSSDGAQETNHEEDKNKTNGKDDGVQQQQHQQKSSNPTVNDEGTTITAAVAKSSSSNTSGKDKQKDDKDITTIPITSDSRPEFQESRAADAMLMLQGSSSDGGEGGGSGSGGGVPSSSSRTGDTSSLMSSHSQGNLGWSLSLGHWWASFLPALAQHHHHSSASSSGSPSSLYGPPRAPRGQISPGTFCGLSGSGGGGSGNANSSSGNNNSSSNNNISNRQPPDSGAGHNWGGNGSSSTSREGSPASGTQLVVGSLDQLALVSALGKEISPQMVQALQAVASRRESFSSAAKLYSVSVTTLWRYYRKLGLSDTNPK